MRVRQMAGKHDMLAELRDKTVMRLDRRSDILGAK